MVSWQNAVYKIQYPVSLKFITYREQGGFCSLLNSTTMQYLIKFPTQRYLHFLKNGKSDPLP